MNAYYLLYVMDNGLMIERSLFSTYEKALSHLAICCRLWWDQEGHRGEHLTDEKPLSEGDRLTVRDYFDYWAECKTYDIIRLEVDKYSVG
jgi:hypothetical protein